MSTQTRGPDAPPVTADDAAAGSRRWRRADGVESLGQVQDSGLTAPAFLVRRGDGQVVQVSELVHLVLMALSADRSPAEAADVVSAAFGRRLSVEGLDRLVTTKLAPVGLVTDAAAPAARPAPRATPLLALRAKLTLLPAGAVRFAAGTLSPLFWPPVVVLALAALVVMDVLLFVRSDALAALATTLATPGLIAALYLLTAVGIFFHELGHATACRYGGATPGRIGAGVYLVFPAFYTDVTDSYRLDRAGRLRTDLGGLYFNVWGLLAAGAAYLLGGPQVLVLYILITHFQMVQQLIPTLRFDGYYVLADLAGVPDLFSRVGPVMRSLVPGRPAHPRVAELRPRARRLVTTWVLVVVPTLALGLAVLVWNLPEIVRVALDAVRTHLATAQQAVADGAPLPLLGAVFAMVVLALPALGAALVVQRTAVMALLPARRAAGAWRARHPRPAPITKVRRHATTTRRSIMVQPRPGDAATPGARAGTAATQTADGPTPPARPLPPGQGGWDGWRVISGSVGAAAPAAAPASPAPAPSAAAPADEVTAPAVPGPPADDATVPSPAAAPPVDQVAAPAVPAPPADEAAAPPPIAPAAQQAPEAPAPARTAPAREPARAPSDADHLPGLPLPLTAAAFTDAEMFPPPRPAATLGWQHAVHVLTGGRISPRPGAAERRYLEVLERVRAPITGSRRVVVMSRKGGVGKTTLALALGSTFALERGDRVIAVDANPDAGNLAHRLARGHTRPTHRSITDVLGDLDRIHTYADLQGYTSQAPESRLEVLASDDDPRISLALTRASYHRVITLLDAFYNLILLDTGTGILDSANQGLIADADQLVLVLRPALDGARAAALTLDWLDQHGHGDLVERAVVVINGVRPGVGVPLEKIEAHFTKRCAHVLSVPWDEMLEKGAQTAVEQLRRPTREALHRVAAAVADNFVEVRGNR
ncbi:MinD/ParA family ATP-binding protein [Georgenia thermotolerans]|uniref:AAA family ATPase n=1 Tax=Georgenia thermotolerans TaxID=527326 RepID=A0A7J5UMN0_9MICO|nr:MinD/ParA family protein [Georgenia thermotolerans]KAE8763521.1 AAA family ATPase [Georgenia thermotolerans]